MDAIDKRILQQIQENSRLSMTELGDRVGLSASACHRRIKAMEDTGLNQPVTWRRLMHPSLGKPWNLFWRCH